MALDSKENDQHPGLSGQLLSKQLHPAFPGMVHVENPDGTILFVTDLWLETLGFAREEVLGQRAMQFFALESRVRILNAKQKPGHHLKQRLKMRNSAGDLVDVIACSIRDGNEKMVSLTDFSAYRAMEDRLLKKQRSLQSYIEGANAGTWEWNVQSGEMTLNNRWAEIVGYALDELAPVDFETWNRFCHPKDKRKADAELERHFAGETEHYSVDIRMRHKKGHWVWVRDRGRVFTRTPEGAPKRMFGTLFDISDQIRHQTEQRKANRLLDRTGQVARVGGWELDLELHTLSWTAGMNRICGVSDDFLPSLTKGIQFFAKEAQETVAEAVETCIAKGIPYDLELPFVRASGERIWVRTVGELEYQDGKPKRINGALQDITQKIRQTDALITANERVALAASSGRVGTWALDIADNRLIWDGLMVEHFTGILRQTPNTSTEWIEALPTEAAGRLRAALGKARQSGAAIDLELDLPCRNDPRALKIIAAPHYDRDGKIETLQGVCLDLTHSA